MGDYGETWIVAALVMDAVSMEWNAQARSCAKILDSPIVTVP